MKLRNKKTGEIGKLHCDMNVSPAKYGVFEDTADIRGHYWEYDSLAELNAEWEDYKEKGWYITENGEVRENRSIGIVEEESEYREIGNYFETEEEAEKAIGKLKAWKRLKDKGFRFIDHIDRDTGQGMTRYEWNGYIDGEDLDLLFGDEE